MTAYVLLKKNDFRAATEFRINLHSPTHTAFPSFSEIYRCRRFIKTHK